MSQTAKQVKRSKSLTFQRTSMIKAADRDYGLCAISTHKARTPYPQRPPPIDEEILVKRLQLVEEPAADSADRDGVLKPRKLNFVSSSTNVCHGSDAPQPHKSSSYNSNSVIKLPNMFGAATETCSESCCSPIGTPLSNKGEALKTTKLVRCLTKAMTEINSDTTKSVCLLTPHQSTSGLSACQRKERWVEFDRRRREFHLAEFKIAKNGKKLNDMQTAYMGHTEYTVHGPRESEEFTKQLQLKGIPKMLHDIVTNINPDIYADRKLSPGLDQSSLSNESTNISN